MAYKVLNGVFLDDDLLKKYENEGYVLVDFEEHRGLYNVILHKDDSDKSKQSAKK